MARSNSSSKSYNKWRTPASFSTASAYKTGCSIKTAFAPNSKALRISVPLPVPPSINTSTLFPTAGTFGRASIVTIAPSNCLPPWLETITPLGPFSTAQIASSPYKRRIKLTSNIQQFWCLSTTIGTLHSRSLQGFGYGDVVYQFEKRCKQITRTPLLSQEYLNLSSFLN